MEGGSDQTAVLNSFIILIKSISLNANENFTPNLFCFFSLL